MSRAVYLTQILWDVSWIAASYVRARPGRERLAAVVAVFGVHAWQLVVGWMMGNVAASAILSSGSALIVAFILPWGAATQAISAGLAGVLVLLQAGAGL